MQISEYQRWLEEWDRARGWDRVSPSHTLVHALEEMGEIARIVLQLEGYKDSESLEATRAELAVELSDIFVFLVKLAYQCDIDLEEALKVAKSIAEKGAVSLRALKHVIDNGFDVDLRNACALEADAFCVCFASPDQKEGTAAFLEKRPGRFTGKLV